jgi:hypothetical protein
VADLQVPLPPGIGGVGGGQPFGDLQAGLVSGPGGSQVPGRRRHVPELAVADLQVPLPPGIGGVGGGQPGGDVQADLVGGPGGKPGPRPSSRGSRACRG